jgi:tRNA C32,U32 (ribose-2'-O)-methylase TrmJ
MDKQQLHEQLEQLHAALHQADFSDNNEREILQKVVSDIQDILARQGDQTEDYRGLGKRLKDAVAQLEAAHPEATLLMRQVIDQLAYMGI